MIASSYDPKPEDGDFKPEPVRPEEPVRKAFKMPAFRRPSNETLQWAGIGSGVVVIIWFAWFMFIATHPETMTVQSVKWERRIEVLDFQPRNRDGWSRPPSDAYDVDRDWRYHYTERVFSHYVTESYSCGTSSAPRTCTRQNAVYRNRDVYDWWYRYKVNRWATSRWIVSGGVTDPVWADLSGEKFDSTDVIGNEQLSGKREEVYTATLYNPESDKTYPRSIPLQTWSAVQVGERMTVHITRGGSIRSVDWK